MVKLRSKFPSYRVRGVQFTNYVAQVDEVTFREISTNPLCGPGLDFWSEDNNARPQSSESSLSGGGQGNGSAASDADNSASTTGNQTGASTGQETLTYEQVAAKLFEAGTATEVIHRKGSWWRFGDVGLGQNDEAVIAKLVGEPALRDKLEAAIKEQVTETNPAND